MKRFIVEELHFCGGWVNCWESETGDGGMCPSVFETKEEAEAELVSFFEEIKEAVKAGDMMEEYDPESFRIREIES